MGGRGSKGSDKFSTRSLGPNENAKAFQSRLWGHQTPQTAAAMDKAFRESLTKEAGWASKVSTKEAAALREYQGIGYRSVNRELNAAHAGVSQNINAHDKAVINDMTKALGRAKLQEDVTVFRGIRSSVSWQEAQKMVGTTQIDPAFGSTTMRLDLANEWTKGRGRFGTANNPYVTYRVHVAAGAKAAWVQAATSPGSAMGTPFHTEYELLMQRGARYYISGAQRRVINGKHYVILDANYVNQAKITKLK